MNRDSWRGVENRLQYPGVQDCSKTEDWALSTCLTILWAPKGQLESGEGGGEMKDVGCPSRHGQHSCSTQGPPS